MSDKMLLGVSKRLQFVSSWVSPKAYLGGLVTRQLTFLKVDNPTEQDGNYSAYYDLTLEVIYRF